MISTTIQQCKSLKSRIKSLLLSVFFLGSTLSGMSLDEVIAKALNDNYTLESITYRISANHANIDLSKQFANPRLSYAQNTIDDNQAMSRQTVTVQQKIPYFGKRDSLQKVAQAEEELLNGSLQKARVRLVNEIKNQAYTIWELERLYTIICDYEDLTRHNIDLFESYTMTSDNQHMGIVSAELTLSDLRIQKSTLNAQIYMAYAKLSYLTSFEVKDLVMNLEVGDMPGASTLEAGLKNNSDIALEEKKVQKKRAKLEIAELNHYPDLSLMGGYSYRKNFDNYWSFGVGISLPVYGREDSQEEEARKIVLSAKSLKEDTKVAVNTEFHKAYLQMKSAYEIYHIVHDEALPQIEHMFELTNSSISTGGDLFKYIDILVQKLKLERKSIGAVANYKRAEAKIAELSGAMQ